jgi:hypothetical protein
LEKSGALPRSLFTPSWPERGNDLSLCFAFSTPPHSFTHHHPSPFPTSENWPPHQHVWPLVTQPCTPHCPPPSTTITVTLPPLILSAYIYVHFSSAIYYTLKMRAARSSKTLVSYHSTLHHHSPWHLDLKLLLVDLLHMGHQSVVTNLQMRVLYNTQAAMTV